MRRSVSQFEIVEKLGEGGMGVVYKARDTRLNRFVALKFLAPALVDSEDAVGRMLREAQAISALNHPNIATIYGIEEDAGEHFLVLEYLPGGTLRKRVREVAARGERLPFAQVLAWALEAAEGLAHAHRHGIVHRDVKSDNLMLSEHGTVKVTDFSLAKGSALESVTRRGAFCGTVPYVSPEQAGGLEIDNRSDIFSFGVVLYELATGELPFQGAHEPAVLDAILHKPAPSVRAVRPDVPEAFERIVHRALEKKRDRRYQRMEDLSDDLRAISKQMPDLASARTLPAGRAARAATLRTHKRSALLTLTTCALSVVLFPSRVPNWFAGPGIPGEKRIAVLPFVNVGADPGNQAFCDGLMETITAKLTEMEQFEGRLRVVPSSEVRKERASTPSDARRAFGVKLALTGSVQRSGEQVRLTASLVDTAGLRQLRSRTIDTFMPQLTALQDGVVGEVAQMLDLELRPEARKVLHAGDTSVPAAYDLYVQGVGRLARFDKTDDLDAAISLLQRAVRQDPGYALAYAGLGEAFWRKYETTREPEWIGEARTNIARAVELNPQSAKAHLVLGMIHGGKGDYVRAVAEFQRALKLDPVNATAYRELARVQERSGRTHDAELSFKKAIELRAEDWTAQKDMGILYLRHGRYPESERCFRRAIELAPDSYLGYRNLGAVLILMERYDEASSVLQKSLSLRPTGQAYSNLGTSLYFQQRYTEAAAAFEKAVQTAGEDQRLWGNLADTYLRAPGLSAKAPESYRQAVRLTLRDLAVNPKSAAAHADLGVYYIRLSDKRHALSEIQQARRLAPDDVTVLFKSGLVYELAGQRQLAIQALAAALKAGYSAAEVQRHPDLAGLRQDSRFSARVLMGSPDAGKR